MSLTSRAWRWRLAMTAVFLGNGMGFGAWSGSIPRLRQAAGLSEASLGLVLLGVSTGAVLTMPLAGRYAARIGTARACWMAALFIAVVLPLPALSSGWWSLLAAAVLLGAGLGLMDVCMNAHAAELERGWGGPIMSSFHAGWSLGQLAGAATAGILAAAGFGLTATMAWCGAGIAVCGLTALTLPDRLPPIAAARAPRFRPSAALLLLGALIGLGFAIDGGASDWSGVYLNTVLGLSPAAATSGLAACAGAMVVMRLAGDAIVRRLGPAFVASGGGAMAAVGFAIVLLAPNAVVAMAGFAAVGAGVANIAPVVFSVAGRSGAAATATVATAGYGALMAAPPIIGFVSNAFGLRAGLGVLLAAAAAIALLARRMGR